LTISIRPEALIITIALGAVSTTRRKRASRACASFRSVMSRVTFEKPITAPSLSRIASTTTLAQNRLPSLRTRQPSASYWPRCRAVCSTWAGMPLARSSSV
jgi:hypothetical protein